MNKGVKQCWSPWIFSVTEFTTRATEKRQAEVSNSKYVLANQVIKKSIKYFRQVSFLDGSQSSSYCMVHQWQRRQNMAEVWCIYSVHHVSNLWVKVLQTEVAQNWSEGSLRREKGRYKNKDILLSLLNMFPDTRNVITNIYQKYWMLVKFSFDILSDEFFWCLPSKLEL